MHVFVSGSHAFGTFPRLGPFYLAWLTCATLLAPQADEFAGYFYVCGKHKTLFDAYEHTMEQL